MDYPKWQLTLWDWLEKSFHKVIMQITLGLTLVVLYTLVVYGIGYFVGNKGRADDMMFAVKYTENHSPAIVMERSNIPFCVDHNNYYEVKKSSNYTFQIVKRQQPRKEGE